ncbi:hypothetical protein NDU88_006149 [Pleurodeles waltl]|uniref:Uncharacterized protein n=1 Tax=Pleurodeles waltl TaxID=8319 RepID=A0AAV7TCS3_PLEWA|nr:hypothetical protein NDU88_006149 [Pleurodeles waltl]
MGGHSPLLQEDGGGSAGMASQRGRGARRTMNPLMFRILEVAYPELDGRLRASQQTQGGEYNLILRTLHAVEVSGWGVGLWVSLGQGELGREGPSVMEPMWHSTPPHQSAKSRYSCPCGIHVRRCPPLPYRPYPRNCMCRGQEHGVMQGAAAFVLSTNGSGMPCTKTLFLLSPPLCLLSLSFCASASTGGGTVAPEHEGAASHMAMEGHITDSECTSGTEAEGSFTSATGSPSSDTDSFNDGSSLVVAAPTVPRTSTGTADTSPTSTALPAAPQRSPRARSPGRVGITFAPGTSGPAPVTPAALSEEAIDLLRSLTVGQSTIVNAIQGVERELQHDTTASTVVTGPETTARVTAQEGPSIVTGQETTARVTAQEGPSIVTGQETTATAGVSAQEGPSIVTGQETTARVTAQEGPTIVTGQETTATAEVSAQESPTIVTGQETTARVTAQEGPSIVTGQETTARVTAQEGPTIVTGQETTAIVTAQEGPSIVTGQETTARVTAQEGPSIVTGQETTTTARVSAQESPTIVTGQETTVTTGVSAQESPTIVTGQETTTTTGVSAQESPTIVTGQENNATTGVSALEGSGCHSPAGQ